MTVGERIKAIREERKISQLELARRLGLKDKSSVCKIEKSGDNISTKSIKSYAKALNVTPAFLMGWTREYEEESFYPETETEHQRENRKLKKQFINEMAEHIVEMREDEESKLGTEGFALKLALYRMTIKELKNLYDVAKIMFPHAFSEGSD